MASKRNNDDEHDKEELDEHTSLLASYSAPLKSSSSSKQPPPSRTSTTALLTDLESVTHSARRLVNVTTPPAADGGGRGGAAATIDEDNNEDVLPDSDSVNHLISGYSDDEGSIGSLGSMPGLMGGDTGGGKVTVEELEFLSSAAGKAAADVAGNIAAGSDSSGGRRHRGRSRTRRGSVSKCNIDTIGNQLLSVDNPGSVLRQSLMLSPPTSSSQGANEGGSVLLPSETARDEDASRRVHPLVERVHKSTRDLRTSMVSASTSVSNLRKNRSYGGGGGRGYVVGNKGGTMRRPPSHPEIDQVEEGNEGRKKKVLRPISLTVQVVSMIALLLCVELVLFAVVALGAIAVGPPRQPIGDYRILEAQVTFNFCQYYNFYVGKDSVGSNGYVTYVSRESAENEGLIDVITENVAESDMIQVYEAGDKRGDVDWLAEDMEFLEKLKKKDKEDEMDNSTSLDKGEDVEEDGTKEGYEADNRHRNLHDTIAKTESPPPKLEPFNPDIASSSDPNDPTETFVYINSSPTPEGPRNSIRLEGRRRFNHGLFLIDLRHVPAGCGTWPAFWLTDEANWPVNGKIDIVEGVNEQDTVKTALHTSKVCQMDDVPEGSKTGSWDTSVGIPDRRTGIPDMTFRWAQNCFVYDHHQWINQGCVATDLKLEGRSLGAPLNAEGGCVYALERDPANRHIRTWAFSPHGRVPGNLREALRTATEEDAGKRVAPDTNLWGLPYGNFPIGDGTNCPAGHFRNMRLIINLAFCGSVAGSRFFMDCPKQNKTKFKTCEKYVASDPEALKEAYWKIRGVYVYERVWERQWTS